MPTVNLTIIQTFLFDEDALTTGTPGDHVLNFGALTTFGDLANGIFAGANNVSISNFSDIETFGLGAAGIYVEGEDARIENHGAVVTHGEFYGDFEFFSEGIFANGDRFTIANYGKVHVEGSFSSALVGAGADGIIVNYGHVDSIAFGSSAIAVIGDRSEAINVGLLTIGDDISGMFILGADASALNTGRIVVNGTRSDGMDGDDDGTHITNRGLITVNGDNSFAMGAFANDVQVANFAHIVVAGTSAAGIAGRGTGIEVVNAGDITTAGDLARGISLGLSRIGFSIADQATITNRGAIETSGDGGAGIAMIGDDNHLINSGRITTNGGVFDDAVIGPFHAAGVVVSGDAALVANMRTGVIWSKNAGSAAVELNLVERPGLSVADTHARIDNFGLIKGAGDAILGGAGAETVINHGRIVGDVVLGAGADTFVFGKGGTLAGDLLLGGGNDRVLIENGAGKARIADFGAGSASGDVIDVSAFFSSFAGLTAHSSQQGNNVVVALDHNDQLVLANVQLNDLNTGDFLFV